MIERSNLITLILATTAPGWTILVRLLVGLIVFFPEGIQKLIFPDILGAGRFAHIGIPYPEVMGSFCRRLRDAVRRTDRHWTADADGGDPAHYHHDRRDSFDESSDLAGPRFLDFSCAEASALRVLEHGPRSSSRFRYAARINLSADRRSRRLVDRCLDRATPSISGKIGPIRPAKMSTIRRCAVESR
jgi:hypothetical protein